MRRWRSCAAWALVLTAGCATSPYPPSPGPRVQTDDKEWRRKSVPLPPVYLHFTSGSGKRWTMVTPLYWQAVGAESASYNLLPIFGYSVDRVAKVERGHVLNYFWGERPDHRHWVAFPVYWRIQRPGVQTTVCGPAYRRAEETDGRRRLVVFPWLFSRETDKTGYDYWGILFRLVGYEKQVFDGEQKERLWLFFSFHINTV